MKNFFVLALITLTISGCATMKTKAVPQPTPSPTPEPAFSVTLTPQELADAFEYRDQKISQQLEQLRKDFLDVEKRIISLRNQISKQVKDCLCPGEMK